MQAFVLDLIFFFIFINNLGSGMERCLKSADHTKVCRGIGLQALGKQGFVLKMFVINWWTGLKYIR